MDHRPPIIVILGHVDHGKTTLLDYLRKSSLAAREAGGITQHIRSFQLTTPSDLTLTFIDTPGHAAFSQMRGRGSQAADIALLIVAANDGVMPQTKEAAAAITQAGLPYIVVITKSDLPEADPDRVKTQLTEIGIVVEDFGGTIPAVTVSAKTGQGIPDLLEIITLLTQLNPLQTDPRASVSAIVLESRLDPKKGPLADVIVKSGTLTVGQPIFSSQPIGKARALINSEGVSLSSAPPSTPVQIIGLSVVPPVGALLSTSPLPVSSTPPPPVPTPQSGKFTFIIKADVLGSLEAILSSLDPEISLLASATGDVSESDVLLARPVGAHILAFNVKVPSSVAKLADIESVPVHTFNIIYELFDFIDRLVHPASTETILGTAVVQAEFKIGPDRVAGCKVTEGQLGKGDQLRLVRSDAVIGVTKFKSLQSGKSALDKAKTGQEFGATLSPYLDFKVGDNIIAFAPISHGKT